VSGCLMRVGVAVAFRVASSSLRSRTFALTHTHHIPTHYIPTHASQAAPRHRTAMLFATLPGPVFAQVVHWFSPQETCWIRDPQSRYADGGGRRKHNAKTMLQCFSLLSKTLHALVRQTPELYFYSKTPLLEELDVGDCNRM